ncbi:MAG: hypothetical protein HN348_14430 [Proteobacteria bacterium]|jgi:hypothetical protein|nr:hypothetical protein [Pseudomonadota bacterium]
MSTPAKIVFAITISLALAFGFIHLLIPDFAFDFDRLHIFLFNLCAGGSILLFYATGQREITWKNQVYFVISLIYALTAFFEVYWATILVSLPLIAIVESVRIKRFSLLPFDFFRDVPTSDKFLQASLLCLSIGATMASAVVLNEEYLHVIHLEKLTMDVFFLGFSFPLSLLTFAVMYSQMKRRGTPLYNVLREVSFWSINLGVITFFIFIIFKVLIAEMIISNILFAAVILTFVLFWRNAESNQPKLLLASGVGFLVITAISGVVYLSNYLFPTLSEDQVQSFHHVLIVWHATVALYGWNLSGLFIIVRHGDFPVVKWVGLLIAFHWTTVMFLVPMGKFYPLVAPLALVAWITLIGIVFFTPPNNSKVQHS